MDALRTLLASPFRRHVLAGLVALLVEIPILPAHAQASEDSIQASYTLTELVNRMDLQKSHVNQMIVLLQDTLEVSEFKQSIHELEQSVKEKKAESDYFLSSYSREWLSNNLMSKWKRENVRLERVSKELSEATKILEGELQKNHEWRDAWLATRRQTTDHGLIQNIRGAIAEFLGLLRSEERLINERIKTYLRFQETVRSNRNLIDEHTERLKPMTEPDFFSYLKRDDTFLWALQQREESFAIGDQLARTLDFASNDLFEYVQLYAGRFFWILLVGAVMYVVLSARNRRRSDSAAPAASIVPYVDRPLIYAYTLTLLVSLPILINRPPLLTQVLLLSFTPTLIILVVRPAHGVLRVITVGLLILYWLYQLTDFVVVDRILNRYLDLFHALLACVLLFLLNRNRKKFQELFPHLYQFIRRSFIPYLLFLSGVAIVLQVAGFTLLSRALIHGCITFAYLAPVILISSAILRDVFLFLEQTAIIRQSALAQRYYAVIFTVIKGVVFYMLFITFVSAFSLRPSLNSIIETIWNFGGTFGEFTVSVGDVLEFFFILTTSWVVSVVLQVILDGEILSRLNLRRGVAMAVGIMVRYSVVVLGFMLAVASTGFDLTKISILAGALGVGIGFGLQNLVANFISGLIIIFERPFVVNDTIESDQIEGYVKEIGIRASKILTYDGAEVIIPNSNLISNRVSNFTLSNNSRRQLIVVRTSMTADPEEVIRILDQAARRHEYVLDQPEPVVVFEGQVEQTLQFKLYYWVVSEMFKTRSDLNVAIYRDLKSLGVELPVRMLEIRDKKS